ncbi:MAG TPA: phosphoribosyltransferase [Pyrinomonadaceae bacterium]|jgi:adenine/guanine phosphoribosyltransferase-like PRPP-binding protein
MKLVDILGMLDGYHRYTNGKRLKGIVEKSARLLQERGLDFNTIAIQGASGFLVGSPLAMVLGKDLMIIKKPGEKTNYRFGVMGAGSNQKILLLDDCVDTGTTLINMITEIKSHCLNPTFVGLFLYTGKRPRGFQYRCEGELINVITFGQTMRAKDGNN